MAGVFRFSNAVSDIDKFIKTYKRLYYHFIGKSNKGLFFTHDEAASFLALEGLASSLGAVGAEALNRSINRSKKGEKTDKSRDPLYNQHKSYSEIFRMLGWYEAGSMQTNFKLTEFGEYIADTESEEILKKLLSLNFLHITSPNPATRVRGGNVLRPFSTTLKLMSLLDRRINRDEMIIGVLACENDKDTDVLQRTARQIRAMREVGFDAVKKRISDIMHENNMQSDATLGNYTRFPISALKWAGWAVSENNKSVYGKSVRFLRLTDKGDELADRLMQMPDIRLKDILKYSEKEQASFVVLSNLQKLAKIGFELGSYTDCIPLLIENCQRILSDNNITDDEYLFFGYQEATKDLLSKGNQILEQMI